MLSHCQCLADSRAALATILGGKLRGDLQHLPASVFSFARKDQKEGVPRHIDNTLRQMMIPDHAGDVQIFDRDRVKPSSEMQCGFMVKVGSPARNFLMLFRQ